LAEDAGAKASGDCEAGDNLDGEEGKGTYILSTANRRSDRVGNRSSPARRRTLFTRLILAI